MSTITRENAFELLKKYNKDPFHLQHAITVEAVMKWFAKEEGYENEATYWTLCWKKPYVQWQRQKMI